jgi:hypothetical protein
MLGKADYPTLEQVRGKVQGAGSKEQGVGCKLYYLDPEELPLYDGQRVPANVYVLGAALGHTALGGLLDPEAVAAIVTHRWEKYAAVNEAAFRGGLEASVADD